MFSVLLIVAGLGIINSAAGWIFDAKTSMYIAGGALLLLGVGKLSHVLSLCPACKEKK